MILRAILHTLLLGLSIAGLNVNAATLTLTDITIKQLDGQSIKLGKLLSDKPVYLKFWASWCKPCMEQMPHLQENFERYGKKIDIISVNLGINDSLEDIKKVQKRFKLSMPLYIDESAHLSKHVDLLATPYHVILDTKGQVVHKGHDASTELDNKLKLLANNEHADITPIAENNIHIPIVVSTDGSLPTLLFFTSTWCDWYLEKRRPQMSRNCISAQYSINDLYNKHPHMNWQGILTRLWTGKKELNDYKKKYNIAHPLSIDSNNNIFLQYKVKNFPTLIAVKKGQEIFRIEDFSQAENTEKMLLQLEGRND